MCEKLEMYASSLLNCMIGKHWKTLETTASLVIFPTFIHISIILLMEYYFYLFKKKIVFPADQIPVVFIVYKIPKLFYRRKEIKLEFDQNIRSVNKINVKDVFLSLT